MLIKEERDCGNEENVVCFEGLHSDGSTHIQVLIRRDDDVRGAGCRNWQIKNKEGILVVFATMMKRTMMG